MAEMTYCTGETPGGFICPMKEHCARATREPGKDVTGWDVFAMPPWQDALKACDFFWPEANPGLTDMHIPPGTVIRMGTPHPDHPHPSGMEIHEETDEQDQVFQMLVKTEGEISTFRHHCAKHRETKPEEVWLLLDGIRGRLHKIIYQGAEPDDNG